jgi:hypothetical protein
VAISLITRGKICPRSSPVHALYSWGVLCLQIRPFLEENVRFDLEAQAAVCDQIIYNKELPPIFDPTNPGIFSNPRVVLTGRREPILGGKAPSLSGPKAPSLYNWRAAQVTGARVIQLVDGKPVLLSDPEEPTLTSSGTQPPDLFDKC